MDIKLSVFIDHGFLVWAAAFALLYLAGLFVEMAMQAHFRKEPS